MATITNVRFSKFTVTAYYTNGSDKVKGLIIDRCDLEGSEDLNAKVKTILEEFLKINKK